MLTVFGSINLDISVRVARLPRVGETVIGGDALLSPGGKGANQAHAAQLFGAPTRLFGAVGQDAFAAQALAQLEASGVDLRGVVTLPRLPTGIALLTVDAAADNAIVVSPGANLGARAEQVGDAALQASRVLLMQLEVPLPECLRLAQRARQQGCQVVLNASPAPAALRLPPGSVDILIVNRIELQALCDGLPMQEKISEPVAQAALLARTLRLDVLVTLGAQGSAWVRQDGAVTAAQALAVQARDTAGAGDTYAGVFAAALALKMPPRQAMDAASVAAALACLHSGTQVAQPTRQAIEAALPRLAP
jgi:ribokinase